MCACVSRPATRGDRAPRGVASACCGRREASGGGGEPLLHAVPSLMCDIGSHTWPGVRDGCTFAFGAERGSVLRAFAHALCAFCAERGSILRAFATCVHLGAERGSLLRACAHAHVQVAQSVGVYSERLRMLLALCAEHGGVRWAGVCAYLCTPFAFCFASGAGDGLRRSRGSVSAATFARNSAARFAASRAW